MPQDRAAGLGEIGSAATFATDLLGDRLDDVPGHDAIRLFA